MYGSNLKNSIKKNKGKAAISAAFLYLFFPFAFRIVQVRNPTTLQSRGRFLVFDLPLFEVKTERQPVKGHKTFLLQTLWQHKKLLRERSP